MNDKRTFDPEAISAALARAEAERRRTRLQDLSEQYERDKRNTRRRLLFMEHVRTNGWTCK